MHKIKSMRAIAVILYIIGALFCLAGIGLVIGSMFMEQGRLVKTVWTGIGGIVMGVLFIQGGRSFWNKD